MKNVKINVKNLVKVFFTFIFSLFTCLGINAQTKSWTTTNPFQTNVFVENFGQFDNWAKTKEPIKYVLNNADKVFFTAHGLVYKLTKIEKLSEEEREEMERKETNTQSLNPNTYYVNMNWEGSSPNATIEVTEQGQGYYTFGEKGYENIKANGYRKLTYKNLYNNIDVEYIIPKKGGIKYSIILHAGADISKVKMLYSGDVEKINKDNEGNIIIATPAGNITDHAPKSFYESTKEDIKSSFELKQNVVSFQLITHNSSLITIIDPWTTTPDSLTTNNSALDISSDNYGNIYISGGNIPYKLAKYSNNGIFLWSFTNPTGWGFNGNIFTGYSKFCLLSNSGTVFIGEGLSITAPRVMKINSNGILTYTSIPFIGNQELWIMYYNRCTEQLMGFGGGYDSSNNLHQLTDTNLLSSTIYNTNGYTGIANDIGSIVMDNNGDFYSLLISNANPNTNYIQKSLFSINYAPPLAFNINTGYNFRELSNYGIIGINVYNSITVRTNALALNSNFLFSYDGQTLKAWNKTTGTLINFVFVNTLYYYNSFGQYCVAAGLDRTYEGIAVDNCNNIWVGGHDTVYVYSFNGMNFTVQTPISTNIIGEVYDINYNSNLNLLAVCGNGFVSTFNVAPCSPHSCDADLINENNNSFLQTLIYPNPINTSFIVKTNERNSTLKIYNITGQLLKEDELILNENTINIESFEKGIYIIEIISDKKISHYKIIKS